jgi:hypothetical protein
MRLGPGKLIIIRRYHFSHYEQFVHKSNWMSKYVLLTSLSSCLLRGEIYVHSAHSDMMGITIGMTRYIILDGMSHIGRQCTCQKQPPCLPGARALRA